MRMIKGALLGSGIFVIFLVVVVYQRLRYGLSTPLSAFALDIFWWLVLLVCIAAGCLIYYLVSLGKRRMAPKA